MKPKHEDRGYQQEMEDAVIGYLFEKPGNPIVAAPGGVGKSYVMARLAKRFITEWPGTRIISLAQDAKLLDQNCNELLRYWPNAPVGMYSSGLKIRETRQPIVFAGIQSVAKRGEEFGVRHIVMIDEADLVSPKEEALYQKFLKALKHLNPFLRVVGFTASPYRMGTGCLTNLDVWDDICIDLTRTERFNWFIEHNFLCPLINKKGAKIIDITNVSIKGGELDEKELQKITNTDEMNRAVVSESIRYGSDRKHWIIFSTGIDHGHNLAKMFNARGIPAAMLSGKDSMAHREQVEREWREGKIRALINCGLYGRGFDFPAIDMIVIARATQSPAWWLQACVRGTRRHPSKVNTLILDMAGNTERLGPVNDVRVPSPRRKGDAVKGEAPIKECENCHSYVPIQCKTCPDCGFVFPPPKTLKKSATDADILRSNKKQEEDIREMSCNGVRYKSMTTKLGKPYLRCSYFVGAGLMNENVFFDTDSDWAMRRAERWWRYRGGQEPIPEDVAEAASRTGELKVPTMIRVDINSQYKNVVGVDFEAPTEEYVDEDIDDDAIPF